MAGPAGSTVLLVSDGHANVGVTDPAALAAVATDARRHGVGTSTLGFGLGYDERVMSAWPVAAPAPNCSPRSLTRSELLYQLVQQAKRRASGYLSDGDTDSALVDIRGAGGRGGGF